MKKNESADRTRGIFLFPHSNAEKMTHEMSSTLQGSRTTKDSTQTLQNRTNFNSKPQATNSTRVSERNAKESSPTNDFGVLAHTLSYCLNTQSKMASMIEEIGLYLRDLSQENQLASANSQKHMSFAYSPTHNFNTTTSRDKIAKKVSIQFILAGLDGLKKEITSKITDFEQKMLDFEAANKAPIRNYGGYLDETHRNVCPMPSPASQYNSMVNTLSQVKNSQLHPTERTASLPHDMNMLLIDNLQDGSLVKTVFSETPSLKHNSFMQSNLLTPQMKAANEKTSEKKELFTNKPKPAAAFAQNKAEPARNQSALKNEKQITSTSVENTTNDSINKQASSMQDNTMAQMNHKDIQKHSKQQSSPQRTHKGMASESITNDKLKAAGKEMVPARRRLTSMGALPTNLIFQTGRSTPSNGEFGQRKNSIKPPLNIIPQKQVADDSLQANTIDQTIQHERSALNLSDHTQNMNPHDKSLEPDTQRGYEATILDEILQNQNQTFMKNTANKEKSIIKNLLKEQHEEEQALSYNKGKLLSSQSLIHFLKVTKARCLKEGV